MTSQAYSSMNVNTLAFYMCWNTDSFHHPRKHPRARPAETSLPQPLDAGHHWSALHHCSFVFHSQVNGLKQHVRFWDWIHLLTIEPWKFIQIVCACMHAQLCPTLCDPVDYSPLVSSVLGIFQARILEWVAMPSPQAFCIGGSPDFPAEDFLVCLRGLPWRTSSRRERKQRGFFLLGMDCGAAF